LTEGIKLNIGELVDGLWVYADPGQHQICDALTRMLGCEWLHFDAWLYGNTHWRNFTRVRQRLMGMREQLAQIVQAAGQHPLHQETRVKDQVRKICRLATSLDNMPDVLRKSMTQLTPPMVFARRGKLDHASVARIQNLYWQMVHSGQKYGAQTKLAQQYGVSVTTIRKLLAKASQD
jgi:hypothetical protein